MLCDPIDASDGIMLLQWKIFVFHDATRFSKASTIHANTCDAKASHVSIVDVITSIGSVAFSVRNEFKYGYIYAGEIYAN